MSSHRCKAANSPEECFECGNITAQGDKTNTSMHKLDMIEVPSEVSIVSSLSTVEKLTSLYALLRIKASRSKPHFSEVAAPKI